MRQSTSNRNSSFSVGRSDWRRILNLEYMLAYANFIGQDEQHENFLFIVQKKYATLAPVIIMKRWSGYFIALFIPTARLGFVHHRFINNPASKYEN